MFGSSNISNKDANEIRELLVMINNKLAQLEERVENIEKRTEKIETSAKNMDDHISFIDNVYDSVKSPFHKVMDLVSFRFGSQSLPNGEILISKPAIEDVSRESFGEEQYNIWKLL